MFHPKSFTALSLLKHVLFVATSKGSSTMLFQSVICTLPVNPELIHEPKTKSELYRGFIMHSTEIHSHFNDVFWLFEFTCLILANNVAVLEAL